MDCIQIIQYSRFPSSLTTAAKAIAVKEATPDRTDSRFTSALYTDIKPQLSVDTYGGTI